MTVQNPVRASAPQFLPDASQDVLWDVVLALVTELNVTRARVDTLERLLAERGTVAANAVDNWKPDAATETARAHDTQAYMQRIFGALTR
jgi:hypothetical protein